MRKLDPFSFNPWLLLSAVMMFQPGIADAGGGSSAGGGDVCEDRIKIIRDDLHNWIKKGGAEPLVLPPHVTSSQYSEQMLAALESAKIRCVGPHDNGFPIEVNGTPKVCRFGKSDGRSLITCDFEKFNALGESDQYVLVHHEYAGLADIEVPNQDDSNYDVSNQISSHLEDQVVKKLAVNGTSALGKHVSITGAVFVPDPSFSGLSIAYRDPSGLSWAVQTIYPRSASEADAYCKAKESRLPTRSEVEKLAIYLGLHSPKGYSAATLDGKYAVLPYFGWGRLWWTSSTYEAKAWVIHDSYGTQDLFDASNVFDISVICVK